MFRRNLVTYSTTIIQLLIGLCIGIAFSLILAPFMSTTNCKQDALLHERVVLAFADTNKQNSHQTFDKDSKQNTIKDEKQSLDYNWNSDDYEPRVRPIPPQERTSKVDSARRPRYISTELGIREKLFVGILTSKDTLDTFGVAMNKTLSHYVTKSVFFMNTRKATLPTGMSMVVFNEEKPHSTGVQMLSFIGKQYVKNYDWFFLIEDHAYVRAKKLFDLVTNTSMTEEVLVGLAVDDQDPMETLTYCDLSAGILLSQSMMSRVVYKLDWCQENLYDRRDSVVVSKCIRHGTDKACQSHVMSERVRFHTAPAYMFSDPEASEREDLLGSLTVGRVTDDTSIYKLHRFYSEHELAVTARLLKETKDALAEIAYRTPDPKTSLSWPLGVEPETVPRTRFDVIRWDYFTETHIYLDGDFNNIRELKGVHKEDVIDVLHASNDHLAKKYPGHYTFRRLVNGYRRFDAARGIDYVLDLGLYDRTSHKEVIKRIQLTRPLGFVELVPMPYVTENSRVNLILPVTEENRDSVVNFLDSYAHTCLESGDNTYLYVVFIYTGDSIKVGEGDEYSVLKSMISFYENKYQNGARIAWTVIQNTSPSLYTVLDTVSRKFSPESLFLMCTVGMELSIEFLNRVRMNTIAGWQVFFPIGFWQYKPNLVYEEKPYPTTIEIDQSVGHFDGESYDHASFYNQDYQYARKQMISTSALKDIDLFAMFLKYHNVHVFRATEPALKLRFRDRSCEPSQPIDAYQRCLKSRGHGLASQKQLAMLIFEHQQKLDQLQMNVMHQQNGPNVGQMKPDMLR